MARRWFGDVGRKTLGYLAWGFLLVCLSGAGFSAFAQDGAAGPKSNRMVSLAVQSHAGSAVLTIKTGQPVGYRYTVYESSDPARVVIDFPEMSVKDVAPQVKADSAILKSIRTTSLKLPSGELGRVEVLLAKPINYKVSLNGNDFVLSLAEKVSTAKSPAQAPQAVATAAPEKAPSPAPAPSATPAPVPIPTAKAAPKSVTPSASRLESVDVGKAQVAIGADGRIGKYRYFTLGAPPRLVVDVYGVRPSFGRRSFKVPSGFRDVRVGTYHNKTRFVFDGPATGLPPFTVAPKNDRLLISWGKGKDAASADSAAVAGRVVTVEAVNFKVADGQSLITVKLSGPGKVLSATRRGDTIRFGVKNACISRALRRTIDASAFPSAVRLVTPYLTMENGVQNVMFAVQLKGAAPYTLSRRDHRLVLGVANGAFVEAKPPEVEKKTLPAPTSPSAAKAKKLAETSTPAGGVTASKPAKSASSGAIGEPGSAAPKYSGQKVSLVFDNIDIRRVLQIIGDVSHLNIIAGQDVKGRIPTLRLVNVPWDQALHLILETQGLGMLQEGNVVRILPEAEIRKRKQAALSAQKEVQDLEPLETQVIAVSYTDLGNIVGPIKNLLSKRGHITQDPRNKQIIVTDVPSVLKQVKSLVKILDTPEKQVMIQARIVEASSSFTRNLGVNWGVNYSHTGSTWGNPSSAGIGLGGDFLIAPPTAGALSSVAGLGSGITFGRVGVDSTVLDLQLSALESAGEGKIISSPRVSTVNGGEATISQGTKIPYQSSGNNGLPKTQFIDANLSLKVKPVINPDRSIILDIDATNSSVGADVPVGTGSAPSVDTKEAKTKLLVRDGETTVIGGIYVENDSNQEVGVPVLEHVPFLGHLFKSTSKTKTRSELLVFITPRIVGE